MILSKNQKLNNAEKQMLLLCAIDIIPCPMQMLSVPHVCFYAKRAKTMMLWL
jgi:hypothetical protein